jgi:hypothetical protein
MKCRSPAEFGIKINTTFASVYHNIMAICQTLTCAFAIALGRKKLLENLVAVKKYYQA